jgi:homocitrate synthase NifV
MNEIRIVDTTLRDGEQSAGIALGVDEKVEIAKAMDTLGVYQIEAGIPAMGGQEMKSIIKIAELGLKSRISVWNRMNIADIKESMSCGRVIIHICVPASDIQLQYKLNKDRNWVVQNMKKCICAAKEKDYEVVIGIEDASRADLGFVKELMVYAKSEGAGRIRYADTVGILHRKKTFDDIVMLREATDIDIEIHAHNDLGMAVANSIAAVSAGAQYVDTTICGIGERAGNCNFNKFILAARSCFNAFIHQDMEQLSYLEELILKKMKLSSSR